ncbi:MAG: MlaD family protein [Opitutaceae bacterium]
MKQSLQTARIGLFFIFGVALIWVAYETLSGGKLFQKPGYTLVASFDDLKELKAADDVRMAGVKIGTVESTRLANRKAEAILRIRTDVKVPDDATARVEMAGLLGTDYVNVDLGTAGAPPLAPGSAIRTRESPDLNAVMAQLSSLGQKLNGALASFGTAFGGKGQGGGLFQKLDRIVTDNQRKFDQTMTNLRDITDKVNRGQGTVGRLVNDPTLYNQLIAAVGDLKSSAANARAFLGDATDMVNRVKSGQGTLGVLLYDPTTAANVKATLQNVRDVTDKIARGEGTLGKLLSDDSLYDTAKTTLDKANRALDTMNDSGPITAVGIVANSLF